MRFLRYIRAYWREPTHPTAYERGRIDALNALRATLEPGNPCHDPVREEIDERLRLAERSA